MPSVHGTARLPFQVPGVQIRNFCIVSVSGPDTDHEILDFDPDTVMWLTSWVYFASKRNVNCDQRRGFRRLFPKRATNTPLTSMSYWNVTLLLSSLGGRVHCSPSLIWAGPVTCFDQQNAVFLKFRHSAPLQFLFCFVLNLLLASHCEESVIFLERLFRERVPARLPQFQPSLLRQRISEWGHLESSRPRQAPPVVPRWIRVELYLMNLTLIAES